MSQWSRSPGVAYDQVNVQAGLDAWLAEPNRTFDLVGVAGFQHARFGLADLLNPAATPHRGTRDRATSRR